MKARVAVYDKMGITRAGLLPVIGLKFSEEIGGGGTCTYEALMSDVDALSAWDAVIKIELERAPGVWINGPAYVTRHQYTHKGGSRRFSFTARGLLEAWADETVLLPEYVVSTMPKRCGKERAVGWMSTAYNPAADPYEPWNKCYEADRTTRPPGWPSGSGAEWISASGATKETESKYFRTTLTITGTTHRLVKFWLSSDESADLFIGGERIIATSSVEEGYKETAPPAKMRLYPGTYAVAVKTTTDFTKGGDGEDPILVAGAILNADGDPSTWVLASHGTWRACRRDDVPPNDVPPGPNPGQVLTYLYNEAKERKATGWPSVTLGFNTSVDSYGVSWANNDIVERMFRYGQDTYWTIFQAWADSGEVDVWMGADLVLHAALRQGQHRALTFTETHFHTFGTEGTEGYGNWVVAEGHGGWVYTGSKTPRREYALEIGQSYSRPIATKIAKASLKDAWRWDASGSMNPPQAGWIPYYDFKLGDDMAVSYKAIIHNLSVTSLSATAGEGGLLWDVEFTEYPPEAEVPPSGGGGVLLDWSVDREGEPEPEPPPLPPPPPPEVGMFVGLEDYVPAPPPE